jgi:hypothetical protein
MKRVIEPEWLDFLPAEDGAAVGARRDLRRINTIMGSARHLSRLLPPGAQRIAELGAGDGQVMLCMAQRVKRAGIEATLVDRAPAFKETTRRAFDACHWNVNTVRADAQSFLERGPRFDAIVANLFLHHFERRPLGRLLELIAERTSFFAACEPRRSGFALLGSRLLWGLGCNAVTRHDAVVSVRAGFSGRELSQLWPSAPGWRLDERAQAPFSHLFTARRA